MSMRKRMSLGGMKGKGSGEDGAKNNGATTRRSSFSSPLSWVGSSGKGKINWATGMVQRSLAAAAVAVDKATKDLFVEFDEQDDGSDAYDMLCAQRVLSQRVEFESRYRRLVETLGDLSLAADVDPEHAAYLLNDSRATEDLDSMLALLRAEERQNSRAKNSRGGGGGTGGGGGSGGAAGGGAGFDDGDDILATPCLEFLLEERVVKLLCELGTADRPPGTMALVLGAMASLLGQVGHPLLPSQAVHDPISKLVAAAGSHGRRGGGESEHGKQQGPGGGDEDGRRNADTAVRMKLRGRVRTNLARLLGAIWRKLREESALLDYFLQVDGDFNSGKERRRGSTAVAATAVGTASDGPAAGVRLRLDVFDRLLPLLEVPGRAGLHAREACLVALSVKDWRVGQYVAGRTDLCGQLSRTLTSRYLALYDTLEELQVAAAFPDRQGKVEEVGSGESGEAGGARLVAERQPQRAEATFTEALSLFLQHLRFCNAVGLVAADTQACVRPSSLVAPRGGQVGGGGDHGKGLLECGGGSSSVEMTPGTLDAPAGKGEVEAGAGVADSLSSQVRQLLLGEAIGPALSSALESRARFAQAIAARTIAELSAGVEGYGVAVAGIAAYVGTGGGCRRQLGPLLDTVSSFLVGGQSSWCSSTDSSSFSGSRSGRSKSGERAPTTRYENEAGAGAAAASSTSGSMVVLTSTTSSNVSLRDVLLRRLESSSPSLRVSTLELLAALAELRDDRVLLDLALRPESASKRSVVAAEGAAATNHATPGKLTSSSSSLSTPPATISVAKLANGDAVSASSSDHRKAEGREDVRALLDASSSGALEGLRVSRSMVGSFGSAFNGSPIHPTFRRFSAAHVSLEGYLVEAHQRQIQQLMERARADHAREQEEGGEEEEEEGEGLEEEERGGREEEEKGEVEGGGVKEQGTSRLASIRGTGAGEGGSSTVDGGEHGIGGGAISAKKGKEAVRAVGNGDVAARRPAAAGRGEFDAAAFVLEHGKTLAVAADVEGSFIHALFNCLEAVFERTLEENVAVTGVLSSLCLAATATEVSPVRRLLLVLLFDGTRDAPFRSMRRILEKLWASAQARIASVPNAQRLLAQARSSLGMPAGECLDPAEEEEEEVEVTGIGVGRGSRGMREELTKSRKKGVPSGKGGNGGAGAGAGGGMGAGGGHQKKEGKEPADSFQQQQQRRQEAHFFETYVFVEEFLKEIFCALSAKSNVESQEQGLSESHHQGSRDLRAGRVSGVGADEADMTSPRPTQPDVGAGQQGVSPGKEDGGGGVQWTDVADLPTSLDEFLRSEAFPTFVSPPVTF